MKNVFFPKWLGLRNWLLPKILGKILIPILPRCGQIVQAPSAIMYDLNQNLQYLDPEVAEQITILVEHEANVSEKSTPVTTKQDVRKSNRNRNNNVRFTGYHMY